MRILLILLSFLSFGVIQAQDPVPLKPKTDSIPVSPVKNDAPPASKALVNKYDSLSKIHKPRTAAIRSAILPGLGQIYNKKYWKVPIVWGALGVTTYIFFDNLEIYQDSRFAYKAKYQASQGDSSLYPQIKPEYEVYSMESLRANRDQFRKYLDYSVLFFIIFWGLNVVDAAVDGHLKAFDVSPDLSFKIKPGHSQMANTNGISLILAFK